MSSLVHLTVDDGENPVRLDVYLAEALKSFSRSHIKKLIQQGSVTVNQCICTKAATVVQPGQSIAVEL
ncbi:MAG TPA: S4 domain-containing protein, partial [Candidatus Hydrogenedentes bacterium]|nr:S4 domain-containing protein [Candidatus Hydrogenedentota bacterium]